MILPIYLYGAEVLRNENKEADLNDKESLLKLVEGSEVNCESLKVSTEHMLFIFGGAFSGIRKERKQSVIPIGFDREKNNCTPKEDNDSLISRIEVVQNRNDVISR